MKDEKKKVPADTAAAAELFSKLPAAEQNAILELMKALLAKK